MAKDKNVFDIKRIRELRNKFSEEVDEFEEQSVAPKYNSKRKRSLIIRSIVCIIIVAGVGIGLYLFSRTYDSYQVINSSEITDYTQLEYKEYMDNLIKYSKDGITYINKKGSVVWSESYAMKRPFATVSGEYVAVADLNGNSICVFNSKGKVSNIELPQTIRAIDIGSQGVFVVVLEDVSENYINLYDKNGEIIYEMQKTINNSGYPLAIALSEDGKKLFTSNILIEGVEIKNGLAAYNFSSVGQNTNSDRFVGGYKFDDTIIAKVEFLDNDTVCAFGDNQFIIYSMKEKPSEKAVIEFDKEIRSVFSGKEYIGVVYENDDIENSDQYVLEVFNTNGRSILKKSFNIAYNKIHLINNEIVIVGDSECRIYTLKGKIKFSYSFGKKVVDVIPNGNYNEYIVLHEDSLEIIRLKHSKE